MEKYHKNDVAPIEKENERDENYHSKNPQIDSTKTHQNYHTIFRAESYTEYINQRIASLNLPTKPRKDAVVMNSFVVGSDKDFFDTLQPHEVKQFFLDCTHFFAEKYGTENIISAVVHLDETTPHMHLNIVPINDGRLSSKSLFDRNKLSKLQTDFHEAVGKKYRLQRGQEGSQEKHLSTAEYKAKQILVQAETQSQLVHAEAKRVEQQIQLQQAQNEQFAQALSAAQSGEQTNSRHKLKDQVTALKMENERLKQENTRAHKDNETLFQEAKKLEVTEQKLQQTQHQLKQAKQLIGKFVKYEYPSCKRIFTFFPTLMSLFVDMYVSGIEQQQIRQQYADDYEEENDDNTKQNTKGKYNWGK